MHRVLHKCNTEFRVTTKLRLTTLEDFHLVFAFCRDLLHIICELLRALHSGQFYGIGNDQLHTHTRSFAPGRARNTGVPHGVHVLSDRNSCAAYFIDYFQLSRTALTRIVGENCFINSVIDILRARVVDIANTTTTLCIIIMQNRFIISINFANGYRSFTLLCHIIRVARLLNSTILDFIFFDVFYN